MRRLPLPAIGVFVCALSALAPTPTRASSETATPAPAAGTKPPPNVEIAGHGESAWRIEVPSKDVPAISFAARELSAYVEKMSGARLAVGRPARGKGPRIVLGLRHDLADADRKLLPPAKPGHDGYAVRVAQDAASEPRIVVGGDEPRGVVYAVYDLLERMGCRFVHPTLDPSDPEVVPRVDELRLATGAWAVASPMKYRTLAWFELRKPRTSLSLDTTREDLARQIDWAMKARYNAFESSALELPPSHPLYRALLPAKERGMLLRSPGHNFELFLPSDAETFAAHPEWFGMKDGKRVPHQLFDAQFCWSNAEARKRFVDSAAAFVLEREELDIFVLSGIDGGAQAPACTCPVCSARHPSDGAIELANEVVARLREEAPHVVVETLGGYQYSGRPPKTAKPDPALRVLWAHWGRVLAMSYANPEYARRKRLELWAALFGNRLTAFQYYSDHYVNPWLSASTATQIAGDREFLTRLGADGMLNLLFPDGYWWRESLNAYLAGRSFYDPSVDPLALLEDYARAYHGPAAGPLMAAYYAAWAQNPPLAYRTFNRATPADRAAVAEQRKRWIDPAVAAAKSDPVFAYRMSKAERVHRLAERMMDADLARTEAMALREAGDLEGARAELERAERRTTEAADLTREVAAAGVGLVDPILGETLHRWQRTIAREVKGTGSRIGG